jgi:hypothetical protein
MKRTLTIRLFMLAICVSGSSIANEEQTLYLGLGSAFASYEGNLIDSSISFESGQRIDDNTTMLELYAGYQLNPYISVELGYADLGSVRKELRYNSDVAFILLPQNIEKRQLKQISVRTLLEYPLSNKLNIVGLLGYSYFDIAQTWTGGSSLNIDSNDNFDESGLFYGFGGKYSFNNKYAGKLIWAKSEADSFNLSAISLTIERTIGRY